MLNEGPPPLGYTEYDICIVGAGPVGLALAVRLCDLGKRVLLLESGGTRADPDIQELAEADVVDPARHDPMSIATSRQLGGTSNLWGARVLPFDPIDFAPRDWIDAHWPIGYDEIEQYFAATVEATTSGAPVYRAPLTDDPAFRPLVVAGGAFEADALERWANKQPAQVIHEVAIREHPRLDLRLHTAVIGLNFAENGTVTHVRVKDTRSGNAVTLPVTQLVLAAGGLECARLLLNAQAEAPMRFGGESGPLGRYYMGHLVGEIAEIAFSDPALARAFDFQVDRYGSYSRRRIVPSAELQLQHRLLNCAFWPVVPRLGHANHGSAILSAIYLVMRARPVSRLIVAEKIRQMNLTSDDSPITHHLINLLRGAPTAAAFGADFMRKRFNRKTRLPGIFVRNPGGRYGLSYHSEQSPIASSRVTLAGDQDRLGLRRLTIDLRFASADAEATIRAHSELERWLREGGIGRLNYHLPEGERISSILAQAAHGTHQIGIVRMGTLPSNGVVDRDLTVFGSPNLHVASSAVLPTSGQANPTFTAIALGLRLADRLARV